MKELSLAGNIRKDILYASLKAGRIGAHIASSMSIVEICIAILSNRRKDDVFILSKAHGGLGYYASMHQLEMISDEQFDEFERDGGDFPGQPSRSKSNCIEYSGGSLGMGLSYASGRAYTNRQSRVFIVVGDGELDEGSNWEAISFISSRNLNNVYIVVDKNGLQSDGLCEEIMGRDIKQIFLAYNYNVIECDGHDIKALGEAIRTHNDKPTVIIARTIKGKGISFMENNNEWHHRELTQDQYNESLFELVEKYAVYKE